jgi:hypothetical protein
MWNWVTCEGATIEALSFPEFLTALRDRWLDFRALYVQKLNVTQPPILA